MQFQQDAKDHPLYIKSYDTDKNQILIINQTNNEQTTIQHNFLILFDKLITQWNPSGIKSLSANNIAEILSYKPELILIGTGEKLIQLDYQILEPLYQAKMPFELMTTINACRTYNLLASEHRKIAAAMILK